MPLVLQRLAYASKLGGSDPEKYWWWITDDALAALAAELRGRHYCVVDGLLGEAAAATLRREVQAVRAAGGLALSKLAGGRTGRGSRIPTRRCGATGWAGLTATNKVTGRSARSRATYSEWTRWCRSSRRCSTPSVRRRRLAVEGDGRRVPGRRRAVRSALRQRLPRRRGREGATAARLTAILYLNPGWRDVDGGALRLFAPRAPWGVPPVADVEPLNDRPVLFYADYRVPHEVLGPHSDRLAITLWYFDGAERERAQRPQPPPPPHAAEAAAIAGEIERFEARFGAADARERRAVADPESRTM